MGHARVPLAALGLLAIATAGCVQAMRYDLVPPTVAALTAENVEGLGLLMCVAGAGPVYMLDKNVSETEVCGETWLPGSTEYANRCFPREFITHVVKPHVVNVSAFEPLQVPSCET